MNLLLIEDNEHKKKKLMDFIYSISSLINIDEASSYNTGLNKCLNGSYDLLILDMSMPTYDKSCQESGGRFRTYGGKDIIRKLKRKNLNIPFIIVSQYPKFNENSTTLSLKEIGDMLKEISPENYIKTIFYDTSSSDWKNNLEDEVMKLL